MKKRIIALLLALCLAAALSPVTALADGDVFFTAVNDTLLPLYTGSMPVYSGGVLYLPLTLFTSSGFGIYYASFGDRNVHSLYSVNETIFFDLDNGDSFNVENEHFYSSAMYYNGQLYVPAYFTCGLFGLSCSVITSGPAPVARVYSSSASYSNSALIAAYTDRMQAQIDALNPPSPDDPRPPAATDPEPTDYHDVTLFLSFFSIAGGCGDILDALDDYGVRACFFLTADEIAARADDVRRICGSGHSVGFYFTDGSLAEYERASALLYEAAMETAVIVTAPDDVSDEARESASRHGLLFRAADETLEDGFASGDAIRRLSTVSGNRQTLLFPCGGDSSDELRGFLRHVLDSNYSVGQINEVSVYAPEIA